VAGYTSVAWQNEEKAKWVEDRHCKLFTVGGTEEAVYSCENERAIKHYGLAGPFFFDGGSLGINEDSFRQGRALCCVKTDRTNHNPVEKPDGISPFTGTKDTFMPVIMEVFRVEI
jgi:hypothetical protein